MLPLPSKPARPLLYRGAPIPHPEALRPSRTRPWWVAATAVVVCGVLMSVEWLAR
jgi:hypothetical protein